MTNETEILTTMPAPVAPAPTAEKKDKGRKRNRAMRNLMNRNGTWYFKKMLNGRVNPVSLGTTDLALAKAKRDQMERAAADGELEKIKGVRSKSATLKEVFDQYTNYGGLTRKTIEGNKCALMTVLREGVGKVRPVEEISLDELTRNLARDYQRNVRAKYEAAAAGEKARRMARDRADRTTKSTLRQAKSLFCKQRGLVELYKDQGLMIPETVAEFCEYKAQGTMATKLYFPVSDEILRATFTKIEELRGKDQEVYDLFWLALGTGCRRGEAVDMTTADLVDLNGALWVGAGLGKDGKQIQIPVINWPVHEASKVVPVMVVREAIARAKAAGREQLFSGKQWERVEILARRLNEWLGAIGWQDEKKMHALRAFIGSKIYSQKPLIAQRYLRHKSIATTEKFYSHFLSLEGVLEMMPANVVPMPSAPAAAPIAAAN